MRCVEGVSRLWGEGFFFVILGVQAWTLLECGVGGLESAFSSETLKIWTPKLSEIVLLERLRPQPHAPSFLN